MKIKAEFTFPSELKNEAIICSLCKDFDIVLNIVEASFSTDTSWAILVFEGSEQELKKVFAYLKNKNIEVKDTQTVT
jgi:hypothetical protein